MAYWAKFELYEITLDKDDCVLESDYIGFQWLDLKNFPETRNKFFVENKPYQWAITLEDKYQKECPQPETNLPPKLRQKIK